MDRVKIAFIGTGNMGQCAHLRHYASLPECEVIALAELRPGLAAQVAARYGVPKVYASHEELLAHERPEALVCAQPFTRHGTLLSELAQAGLPIMIEKPLAASIEQGERIIAALRQSGAWLMVGYHKRSDPATMWAKAEIERLRETGELGRMTYVRITMPPGDWIAGGFNELITSSESLPPLQMDPPPGDMTAEQLQEYVRFVNYYIHQVNLLRHLLGEGYEVTHADPAGVLLVARSASGLPGLIEMQPYRTTRDWQEVALVCFEQGYLRIELPAPVALNVPGKVTMFRDPEGGEPQAIVPVMPPQGAMRQQAVNFVRAVRGEAEAMCGAEEALEDLRVARQYLILMMRGR
jgi:predicted dehydrogenase